MTEYDLMKAAESILGMLAKNNVDVKDVNHIEMYEEYNRL